MALRAPWGRMQGAATRAPPLRIAPGWPSWWTARALIWRANHRISPCQEQPASRNATQQTALRRRNLLVAGLLRAATSTKIKPSQIQAPWGLSGQGLRKRPDTPPAILFRTLLAACPQRRSESPSSCREIVPYRPLDGPALEIRETPRPHPCRNLGGTSASPGAPFLLPPASCPSTGHLPPFSLTRVGSSQNG
jgi:hypothetical protein